jgi:MinD superfamily P-loop ATPase
MNGQWFVSETRCGPMVHAELGVAEENSGKLVHLVRTEAKKLAEQRGFDLIIIDGSPGIGCPVIASITTAHLVLVVTEPTLSGLHDLERVAELTRHFGIETIVAINKWDLNAEVSARIESQARLRGLNVVGKVRYDTAVTAAQIRRQAVVEYSSDGAAADITQLWTEVSGKLAQCNPLVVL